MFIYDAEMLEDDNCAESLDRAQKARDDAHEAKQGDPELERCIMCKRDFRSEKVYRTGAGSVCFHCSHEFSDEAQR